MSDGLPNANDLRRLSQQRESFRVEQDAREAAERREYFERQRRAALSEEAKRQAEFQRMVNSNVSDAMNDAVRAAQSAAQRGYRSASIEMGTYGDKAVDAGQQIVVKQLRAKGYKVTPGTREDHSRGEDVDYYHTIDFEW